MPLVIFSLMRSFGSFGKPGLWRYLIVPPVAATVVWLVSAFLWLGTLIDWLVAETPLSWVQSTLADWHLGWIASAFAFLGGWVILLGGAYLLAVIIVGVWSLPAISKAIAATEYPDVAPRGRDNIVLATAMTLKATVVYLVGWTLTLPVWIVPGMAVVHSFYWLAYLNRATFALDAILPYASKEEWAILKKHHAGKMWMLGLIAAFIAHIPILGFFAPGLAGAAFVHYGLGALKGMRGTYGDAIEGEFVRTTHDGYLGDQK